MEENKRIIVIDDDPVICEIYKKILTPKHGDTISKMAEMEYLLNPERDIPPQRNSNFTVNISFQGQEGLSNVISALEKNSPYAVAFIDIRMPPGWDGMETAKKIREIDPNIEIVIVTAFSDRTREEILETVGTPEKLLFLRKPFDADEIFQLALSLTEKWNIRRREELAISELIHSEARFRALVETTNDFVWETDKDGNFTYCSPLSKNVYGYNPDELQGSTLIDLTVNGSKTSFTDFLTTENHKDDIFKGIERRVFKKEGNPIFVETNGTVIRNENCEIIGYRGIDRDISERKMFEQERLKHERQYRQSQKLEAIGTLAGGIAHDFNNILSGIMGYTQLASYSATNEGDTKRLLGNILKASNRAADLVNQILTFSRQTEKEMKKVNIGPIIKETLDMLRASIPSTIKINYNQIIVPEENLIQADPTQINQMLVNLCTNAAQAMKENGGVLEISLESLKLEKEMLSFFPDMEPAKYLKISVSDTGHGITQDIIEKIFEPFYTTKPVGEGTGLGLSVVHGIIKSHGGSIKVYSEPNIGTTFNVFLPILQGETEIIENENTNAQKLPTGTERILFVDDEVFLKEIGEELITSLGYRVIATQDSIEAYNIFLNNRDQFDLIITDMTMPDMTGEALAQKILAVRPEIPIILCSGFFNSSMLERIKTIGIREYVMKPIDLNTMATVIRTVLDA